MQSARLAPPNSIILVLDTSASFETPELGPADRPVWATSTAVVVGTLAEMDGETDIILGRDREVDPGSEPSFVGRLKTPSGVVSVVTVLKDVVLSLNTGRGNTTLRIWTNDPSEPTEVRIGVS